MEMISAALKSTAAWLGLDGLPETWLRTYYQTANRLAHLYFLREVCDLDAYLAFVCFVDDPTHNPTAAEDWKREFVRTLDALEITELPESAAFVTLEGVSRSTLVGAG